KKKEKRKKKKEKRKKKKEKRKKKKEKRKKKKEKRKNKKHQRKKKKDKTKKKKDKGKKKQKEKRKKKNEKGKKKRETGKNKKEKREKKKKKEKRKKKKERRKKKQENRKKKTEKAKKTKEKTKTKQETRKTIRLTSSGLLKVLKEALRDLNICSREWIIRQYDHEVLGQTIIKPLQGNNIEVSGPGDAAVIFPYAVVKDTKKGIVLSNGLNPTYGKINAYKMASSVIEEALRNAVCVGGNIEKLAVLDNFCWGNPNKPKILGSLVSSANACYDMSKAFGIPFISGKDSLHNEYSISGKKISIPPVLLISAVGIIDNAANTITMPFKSSGNKIYILGITRNELGSSVFAKIKNIKNGIVPDVYPKESSPIMKSIYKAVNKGLIESCHDASEGGLAVSISEMSFASGYGVNINIDSIKTDDNMSAAEILFSESNGRFIVEVEPKNENKFKKIFKGSNVREVGYVTDNDFVIFESQKEKIKIKEKLINLLNAWRNTINW
ncbi:MAG: hypothetical protein LBF23_02535, partial [Endomicrobium sp.]|nr:hypothetical protein [Endomicrobium sp.]